MAASELNNRLDYLISYSSQLVFVCSDKIQQQSQVIDGFLEHQDEQADLAILTANELTPLVTYRQKLFEQLLNQNQDADFSRPLNQLLASLNDHEGPILISVFQAEKLPSKLVKELWDLVLQSRFANNKQHLNVLLMGLSDWAESAKLGLGSTSKDQPIMLNNQDDTQHVETHEFSDLESFIQNKREKFAQRLEDRHHKSYIPEPIYKKWWVSALSGLLFLAIFVGMLSWQYPDQVNALVSNVNAKLSTKEPSLKVPDTIQQMEAITAETPQITALSIEEVAAPVNISTVQKPRAKDILVTDWNMASAKLKEQSNKVLVQSNQIKAKDIVEEKQSSNIEPNIQAQNVATNTQTVNDYQVEDNVSFEPPTTLSTSQLASAEQPDTQDVIEPTPDVLLALPDNSFVIQIAAMANVSILHDYVRDERLSQQLWLYKTQRYGADWYVLLKKQHFPSIEDARANITNLADAMLRNTPFVKSVRQIKQEITRSVP